MKTISMFLLFALSATVYGQDQSVKPRALTAGETQPDTSGERLKQLVRTAEALEQAGKQQEAAEVRQKADRERQALLRTSIPCRPRSIVFDRSPATLRKSWCI